MGNYCTGFMAFAFRRGLSRLLGRSSIGSFGMNREASTGNLSETDGRGRPRFKGSKASKLSFRNLKDDQALGCEL